jgi:uncharacterized protein (TIGR04222 family)
MQLFSSWTGSDFLLFYMVLLATCGAASWFIAHRLRPQGRFGESHEPEDIALLAGGSGRLADSVLADLFARGALALALGAKGKLAVAQATVPASPAGRTLLAVREPFDPDEANRMLALHTTRVVARLRREGLLMRPEDHARLRWLAIAPFIVLILIGLYRERAGSALGEPTGYLVILLVVTALLAVVRFVRVDPRTAAGIAAVNGLRRQSARLRRAPQPGEAGMAVALFGTTVLVGTPWEPVHAMRHPNSSEGGTSSDSGGSSSDSGSGCGGGGCGGCGG